MCSVENNFLGISPKFLKQHFQRTQLARGTLPISSDYFLKISRKHFNSLTPGCSKRSYILKGCVRYLKWCTTSPTYIYHLNEKKSLQSLIISSFIANIAILEKRCSLAICILSTSHTVFMKSRMGKFRQTSFQIKWHVDMPKERD